MKTPHILFLFFFFPAVLCGQIDNDTAVDVDHYKTRKFDGAIFPDTYTTRLYDKTFTPTRQDVNIAEKALRKQLKKLNTAQTRGPFIHRHLRKYKRQYFGFIDADGHKIVLINCFWDEPDDDDDDKSYWLRELVRVFDGGSYYWRVKLDLTTGKLFDLRINGYA